MADFRVGDTVLCVTARSVSGPTGLVAGTSYRVVELVECCGATYVRVAGVEYGGPAMCPRCAAIGPRAHFAWRFIKPDAQLQNDARQLEEVAHA